MVANKDKKLGKRIQKLRKNAGLTQEQLAEKIRLSSKYVQFIENGNRMPSLKTVYKIARTLGTKAKDLFSF